MSTTALVAALAAGAVLAVAASISGAGDLAAHVRLRRRAGLPVGSAIGRRQDRRAERLAGRVRAVLTTLVGEGRARRRADRQLPVLLDQITRQLRSGASLPVAVQAAAVGADDPGTGRLGEELAAGSALAPAVDGWRRACPTPARSLAAAALILAADAGGAVALVLDGVTDTLRDRVALEREVAALSSQARASAAVLVVAPLAFAGLAAAADRRVGDVLLRSPMGWACIAAGLSLDVVGALWMARLAGRAR